MAGQLRPNESIFCGHVNIYFACSSEFIQDITMKCAVNKLQAAMSYIACFLELETAADIIRSQARK